MHIAASEWISRYRSDETVHVLDLGGRNINGTAMDHFPNAVKTVLDIASGGGVDIVADAATWTPDRGYDVVVSAECFEHTALWPEIIRTAFAALKPGGLFVITCAGPGRFQHSAVDGGDLYQGEHYANVSTEDLTHELLGAGFHQILTDTLDTDSRAAARRPE